MITALQEATGTTAGERIALTFPAAVDLVVLARFVAATVGVRAGLDVEEIEDLRLAVDELCVSLGPVNAGDVVRMDFVRAEHMITVTGTLERRAARAGAPRGQWQSGGEVSEDLLDALVDLHGRDRVDGCRRAWLVKSASSPS